MGDYKNSFFLIDILEHMELTIGQAAVFEMSVAFQTT